MLKRVCQYLLFVAMALLVGVVGGVAYSYRTAHRKLAANRLDSAQATHLKTVGPALAELGMMEMYAMREGVEAEDLQRQAATLAEMKQRRDLTEIGPAISTHLGFTYLRLANLEERAHHPDAARDYMTKAQREFQSVGWKDCSEAALQTALSNRVKGFTDSRRVQDKGRRNEKSL